MNYDKIKSLEASILEAIKKHDCDWKELTKFAEECFAALQLFMCEFTNQENHLTAKVSEV